MRRDGAAGQVQEPRVIGRRFGQGQRFTSYRLRERSIRLQTLQDLGLERALDEKAREEVLGLAASQTVPVVVDEGQRCLRAGGARDGSWAKRSHTCLAVDGPAKKKATRLRPSAWARSAGSSCRPSHRASVWSADSIEAPTDGEPPPVGGERDFHAGPGDVEAEDFLEVRTSQSFTV